MMSVSALTSYLYCRRKTYLNYVLKIYGAGKKEVLSGRIKHEVIDYVNKNEKEIVEAIYGGSQDDIELVYRGNYFRALNSIIEKHKAEIEKFRQKKEDAVAETWPVLLKEAKVRARNVFDFMQKHKLAGKELWERLTPKYISEVPVASFSLGLNGKIDKVEMHSEDCFIPFELKTGKAPKEGMWDNHRIQLACYIMLLKEKYAAVNEGFLEYLDAGDRRKVVLNPFIEDEVKTLIVKVKDLLDSSVPPEKDGNEAKCAKCELCEQCSALK
ncbi:MAG TPA: CRISPR-associated protein Cas4 [Nanoarchaeota archaeon]|nr:CRISPR-associated protein Cas4 [Nanoarchaeota archaeon]